MSCMYRPNRTKPYNFNQLLKPMTIVYLFTLVFAISLLFLSSPSFGAGSSDSSQETQVIQNNQKIQENQTSPVEQENQANQQSQEINTANPSIQTISSAPTHQWLLYSMLVAEIAAQRQMPDVALSNFLKIAKTTKNPVVAKEATEWAVEFQNPAAALEAAKLWANTDRNDLQAQLVAATLIIGQSIKQASPFLIRAIELDPKDIGQQIVAIQARLSTRSAEQLKTALSQIAESQPRNPYANLVAAQSAAQQEDIANSTKWVDITLNLKPDMTAALQLKAKLIRYGDSSDVKALKFLKEKVNQFSYNSELRLFYANALLDANQYKDASIQLKKIADDKVYGGQALLFLGEIYRKQGDYTNSSIAWNKALSYSDTEHNAAYLLAELSEQLGKNDDAIDRYINISTGPYYIAAQLRAAGLLKSEKKYDKAIQVLHDSNATTTEEQKQLLLSEVDVYVAQNQLQEAITLLDGILDKLPNDEDTLLAHSIVSAKMKRFDVAEKDLKSILQQNPNNTDALNAMGYIMLQSKRIEEAKPFIEEALAIAPNNPTYLDSMAWYYYLNNQLGEAIKYSKIAYSLSKDVEIAAHYGEILWAIGKKEEAKEVWAKAMEKNPDDALLLSTISRLKVEFKPIKIVRP